ncbi:MAG: cytochrome c [Candidatus Eremiobacteraeota bacterium]|nr:cytochrome c [Candidatus Eremiobacteraeota bacterium]
MRRPQIAYGLGVTAAAGFLIAGMFAAPKASQAMPTFAQAYGLQCSACHTQVPLLNAYGRYLQRTGYSSLDRTVVARAVPIWLGESAVYNSTAGSGTGTPRTSLGNFALHGVGFITPDVTFHAQQWITQNDQSGTVDTLWLTFNNLLRHDGHLFVGKILNPAPAPYSQDFELDPAAASTTGVGEHAWGATYNNRWGARMAYVHKALDVEAGYYLAGEDLNGLTDFGPGDKTFQWKLAYARPDFPIEVGAFGSNGSIPVSTGTDNYNSVAGYVQVDPGRFGRPGLFAVYQRGRDGNPGVDATSGNVMPASTSRGASFALFEPILRGGATLALRHDFNDNGFGTLSNGNALNLGFNVPHFQYAHGYLEANLGGNSALAGASGGPTWKGMLWLTLPIKNLPTTAAAAAPAPASSAGPTTSVAPSTAASPAATSGLPHATSASPAASAGNASAGRSSTVAAATSTGGAAHGKTLFTANCSACHGAGGAGGGAGPSLKGEKSKKDAAAVAAWIKNPAPPMPKLYPSPLSEKDVSDVAAYIETL